MLGSALHTDEGSWRVHTINIQDYPGPNLMPKPVISVKSRQKVWPIRRTTSRWRSSGHQQYVNQEVQTDVSMNVNIDCILIPIPVLCDMAVQSMEEAIAASSSLQTAEHLGSGATSTSTAVQGIHDCDQDQIQCVGDDVDLATSSHALPAADDLRQVDPSSSGCPHQDEIRGVCVTEKSKTPRARFRDDTTCQVAPTCAATAALTTPLTPANFTPEDGDAGGALPILEISQGDEGSAAQEFDEGPNDEWYDHFPVIVVYQMPMETFLFIIKLFVMYYRMDLWIVTGIIDIDHYIFNKAMLGEDDDDGQEEIFEIREGDDHDDDCEDTGSSFSESTKVLKQREKLTNTRRDKFRKMLYERLNKNKPNIMESLTPLLHAPVSETVNQEIKSTDTKYIHRKRTRIDSNEKTPDLSKSNNLNSPLNYDDNNKYKSNNTVTTLIPLCSNYTKNITLVSFKKVGGPQKKVTLTKISKTNKIVQLQSKHVSKRSLSRNKG